MIISLCIVAFNEEQTLPNLFEDIKKQDYPKDKTELIFVNNGSTDSTGKLMESFAENEGYYNIRVISIDKNNLAKGCNTAIQNFTGDIYVRVDAHARINADFLSKNVKCIKGGEDVCGGNRPCVTQDGTPMQETLLAAEQSMFGSSFASYRREHKEKTYASSLFHIAVKKEVLKKCGAYNENLGRTEDNEFTYRLRKNGYKLCLDPQIQSKQIVRSSVKKILKQKYLNGYWIGLTMGIEPNCFSLFHFAPLCLVLGLIFTIIFAFLGLPILFYLFIGAYLLFDIAITASAFITSKKIYPQFIILPIIFMLLHFGYGIGTLVGLIKMPFWKKSLKGDYYRGVSISKT